MKTIQTFEEADNILDLLMRLWDNDGIKIQGECVKNSVKAYVNFKKYFDNKIFIKQGSLIHSQKQDDPLYVRARDWNQSVIMWMNLRKVELVKFSI
jgi:hypothetical protein